MTVWLALFHIEGFAASHVVVDDSVDEAVEFVALPHELAADGIDLRGSDPVRLRLFVNADQRRPQHQRREANDRHVGGDAVIVVRISLGNGQSLAASLRSSDEVIVLGFAPVQALDQHHGGIMRLLQLHVAEIADRLFVQRPIVGRGFGWRCSPRRASAEACLMAGVAAIGHIALRERRARQHRDRAVHAAASQLHGAAVPRRGKCDLEIDRFGLSPRDPQAPWTPFTLHHAGRIPSRRIPARRVEGHTGHRLSDRGNRDAVAEFRRGAVGLGDGSGFTRSLRTGASRPDQGYCPRGQDDPPTRVPHGVT